MSSGHALIRVRVGDQVKSLIGLFSRLRSGEWRGRTFRTNTVPVIQVLGGPATVSLSARILDAEGFGVMAVVAAVSGIIDGLMATRGVNAATTFATRCRAEGTTCIFRFALAIFPALVLIVSGLLNGRGVSCKNS